MSFQDFSSSRPRNASAALVPSNHHNSRSSSSNNNNTSTSSSTTGRSASDPLSQVSEALLQYQRNVGILEHIVASLTSNSASSSSSSAPFSSGPSSSRRLPPPSSQLEFPSAQYEAQVEVLDHLARKVQIGLDRLSSSSSSTANNNITTAKTKLVRDFERVKAHASQLQDRVTRFQTAMMQQQQQQQQQQHRTTTSTSTTTITAAHLQSSSTSADSNAHSSYYEQVQMQIQQDRFAEEMMREREEEIRNINRGMHQVNEIYRDLAHLVGSQQSHIDQIESHMDESRVNAESGLRQVEQANEKFSSSSSNCIIS